ncbi:MAG: ATP-dependent RNA helicase HrpA [Gammaproteobacteria bacterium]|nr:ATP-dependent RNA helicase HrpA [Gammaproteobacteria bacterium]
MQQKQFFDLRKSIFQQCYGADKAKLLRTLAKLKSVSIDDEAFKQFSHQLEASVETVNNRKKNNLNPQYDTSLPFYESKDDILTALKNNQIVVLCGETGSGKTTQIPQLCFDLGLGQKAQIAHTQPRRLAARSVAQRIASESNTELGDKVGYKVRFSEQVSKDNALIVMTDGMLLSEMNQDRFLNQYEVIIIDEAHERSLNIDLLLGLLKNLLTKRKDLKLIITSATIDTERFSTYFNQAPIINVSGRTYPVEILYRPLDEKNDDLTLAIIKQVEQLNRKRPEDTLVFLPGERQIRDVAEKANSYFHGKFDVLPLYGRLSFSDQQKIFKPSNRAKIVLSTNVAETSLTVPGIRYVIDSGLVRMSRYSWRSKTQGLPIEKISQASANQRSGRCGRVAPGVAVRLYAEEDFEQRPEFTDPEILRTNLATVILQMTMLNMGKLVDFDFIEAPDSRLIKDGYRLLHEIKAVNSKDKITPLGRNIAKFPLDPRFSKMILTATQMGCLHEILVIVSALSIQDPREVPAEQQQKARECHQQWRDDKSDFMSYYLLWLRIKEQKQQLSNNQFKKWCQKNFLAYMRVREWRDVYIQLKQSAKEQKLQMNTQAASSDSIHRAILSGIPSHIAFLQLDDKSKKKGSAKDKAVKRRFADYLATRNRALKIFPASGIKQPPKWLMASSFIDTRFLYAHEVASCETSWLMSDLQHLHQYDYSEPHFQPRYGKISAYRNTKIYNLLIEARKRINFSTIDPAQSRDLLIRHGLVDAEYMTKIDFINNNRELLDFYRKEEDKLRRRELLVDDEFLYDFYQKHLPSFIVDGPALEKWAKQCDKSQTAKMTLSQDDILLKQHDKDNEDYPEFLSIKDQSLGLTYQFNPGTEMDGVTVNIPLALLNQFYDEDFERLVPGLLGEKIESLIRSLPKKIRKNFVPVPEFAQACLDSLEGKGALLEQIALKLKHMTGVVVQADDWNLDSLEPHLQMRYCITKANQCFEVGRSLNSIKLSLSNEASEQFEAEISKEDVKQPERILTWSCGKIEGFVTLSATQIKAFPALVDYEKYVQLEYLDTKQQANFYHLSGIARLIYFENKQNIKYLVKEIAKQSNLLLMYLSLGTKDEFTDDLLMSSIMSVFLSAALPNDEASFKQLIEQHKSKFQVEVLERIKLIDRILTQWRQVISRLDEVVDTDALEDINEQLNYLIYAGFVRDVPSLNLQRYPKYLLAIEKRIDKQKELGNKLEEKRVQVRHFWDFYISQLDNQQIAEHLKEELRWQIEEFRITCFAQPMKPAQPISAQKLERMIQKF